MSKITDWLLKIAAVTIIMLGLRIASALITQILIIIFIAVIISPIYWIYSVGASRGHLIQNNQVMQ